MDTQHWNGFRWRDRWQQMYGQIRDGRWGDVLARLELRDAAMEAHLVHVPQLISRGLVRADAGLTFTGSSQDISGCTATLVLQPGDIVDVDAVADITISGANGLGLVVLEVGGVEQAGQAIFGRPNPSRGTVKQHWEYEATVAGAHVFKLRGRYATAGAASAAVHTSMRWKVWR